MLVYQHETAPTLGGAPAALDRDARAFLTDFRRHIALAAPRPLTAALVRQADDAVLAALLAAARPDAQAAADAWRALYRALDALVRTAVVVAPPATRNAVEALAALRAFLDENPDLAPAAD